ncbi:MAG: hypothetical protein ACLQRM_13750 [Acidimicrobiales bacterium]
MTDHLDYGPPVLRIDVETWCFLGVRRDLVPLLVGLGRFHRRTGGIPAGSELEALLAALERRYAECGTPDQDTAECGNGINDGSRKLLTVSEVSFLSGKSVRTVRGCAGVTLPGRRTSAGWIFEADAVDRWLAEGEAKGA